MAQPGDGDDFSIDEGGEKTGTVAPPRGANTNRPAAPAPQRSTSQPLIPIPTRSGNANPFGPMPTSPPPRPPPQAQASAGPPTNSPPERRERGPDRRAPNPPPYDGPERRQQPDRRAGALPKPSVAPPKETFWPEVPRSIEESGLSVSMIEELIMKAVFFAGEMRGRDIATKIQLPSHIVDEVIEGLRRNKMLDIRGGGASGVGKSTMIFQLTSFATDLLKQILERNKYNGPAPVRLEEWAYAVKQQSIRGNRITRAHMEQHFNSLIVRDYVYDGIGPALNSGRSIFFYGPPGNGKTALCQCMVDCFDGDIFIPHSLLIDDFIIRVFDETVHKPIMDGPDTPPYDHRWVRARRPLVVVGGELTLTDLDLIYSPEVKYYEAPFQVKATNGMLLVDDFGRQQVSPKDLLNRWIVPLESDFDFLTLHTGKKMQVPFDVFTAFSTNLDPAELVDDAFLRRVRYKLEVQRPDEDLFHEIFEMVCQKSGIQYDPDQVQYLIDTHYKPTNRPFAACQPRDIVMQVKDLAAYEERSAQLDPDLIDAAVKSYFVRFTK
ncbi:MAG: ATPase [Myxococcaceae bacterium]